MRDKREEIVDTFRPFCSYRFLMLPDQVGDELGEIAAGDLQSLTAPSRLDYEEYVSLFRYR